jgi:hypothetical protein
VPISDKNQYFQFDNILILLELKTHKQPYFEFSDSFSEDLYDALNGLKRCDNFFGYGAKPMLQQIYREGAIPPYPP